MSFLEYIPYFLKISTTFIIFSSVLLSQTCHSPMKFIHAWFYLFMIFLCVFVVVVLLVLTDSSLHFQNLFFSFVSISTSFYTSRNRQIIFSVSISWFWQDLSPVFTLVLVIQILHHVPSHPSGDPLSRCYCSMGVVLRLGLHFCCYLLCMHLGVYFQQDASQPSIFSQTLSGSLPP